jgi:hypothetical protein
MTYRSGLMLLQSVGLHEGPTVRRLVIQIMYQTYIFVRKLLHCCTGAVSSGLQEGSFPESYFFFAKGPEMD